MLEQRLLDTRKSLEKLASQSGKTLEDILRYLSSNEYDQEKQNHDNLNGILSNSPKIQREACTGACNARKQRQLKQLYPNDKNIGSNENKEIILQRSIDLIENSILNLNRTNTIIMENVVDQMVSKKIYRIRQNFRTLILNVLGIQELSFYAIYESGRIVFQDFASNFITELMQEDLKICSLQKTIILINSDYFLVDLADNSDLSQIFQINQSLKTGQYFGLTFKSNSEQKSNVSLCIMIKSSNKDINDIRDIFVPKLINKIIQISQISTSEQSICTTSKRYTKNMLDLLQILIIQYDLKLKKSLCSLAKIAKQAYYNLTNISKIILSKIDQNLGTQQSVLLLKKLTNQFEEMQYRKIEEIRLYKKYVRENNNILLEFNRVGVLLFISGNVDNQYLNELTRIWEEGKPILDQLFGKNQNFSNYIKKAIRGSLKTQKPLEIADQVQIKIINNGKRIQRIQIIIKDKQTQNKSESKQLSKAVSKNQIFIRRKQNVQNEKTLKQIEKYNPGVSKQGWLDLFLKNSLFKGQETDNRKNNTYCHPTNQLNLEARKSLTYTQQKKQLKTYVQDIAIENINLNILSLQENQLQQFAIRVLSKLDYFQRLPQEKNKLKNFISDLHDGYEIHSNSFHNFRHGINVMHTCYLLSTMPANINILTVKDIFVNVFSGLCHDVGHTGFTNAFQIASNSKKALIYNDRSPLQNFHASLTFQILRKQQNNFLCHMEREQFIKFRKAVIQNILYTDIKQHFPLLNSFNDLLKSGKTLGRQDAPILSYMIVHSSDFAGSIKQFQICKQWSLRVNLEFSNQYRIQGEIGIPQTPFMKDLNNPIVLSKAQCGFLKVIVYPLYQALDNLYVTEGIAHKFKKNIENNIKCWQQINKSQTQKLKALQQQKQNKNT